MAKKNSDNNTIVLNKKAGHEYHFLEEFEAGVALQGWELKSLRAGKINLSESYVLLKAGEAYLFGAHITPLASASTHVDTDPTRTRKLLLHRNELNYLIGAVERKGLTLIARKLYWKKGRVKVQVVLAKGKKLHDKRQTEKLRDWSREKQRILKTQNH